jgi:hypothetical protein
MLKKHILTVIVYRSTSTFDDINCDERNIYIGALPVGFFNLKMSICTLGKKSCLALSHIYRYRRLPRLEQDEFVA